MSARVIKAADLFCGAGGTSTGLSKACESLGLGLWLVAINHWDMAIKTHTANHPWARHYYQHLDAVDPRKLVPSGHLHLMVASPECTHHSIARGGRPISDQSRASAWHVLRWAEALRIDSLLIENVREFRDWGPIGTNGRPLKSKRGETYRAFLNSLRSLGYVVEDRVLNAANYGDPTTRERLFVMARRGRRPITWPDPTHAATAGLFGQEKWRAAREIIDWSLKSQSIFDRKRPLAPATLARIEAGLRKFGGAQAEPFIVVLRRHGEGRSIDRPLPVITAGGNHMGLCEPFILQQQSRGAPRSTKQPLPTIATKGAIGLVEPFLVTANHERQFERHAHDGQAPRVHSVKDPLPTVTSHGAGGLVKPFITILRGMSKVRSVEDPVPTLTTRNDMAMVEPFIVPFFGERSVEDRFALVTVDGQEAKLDIRFRMLQPHELARAMSFDDQYVFEGTLEQRVKQIGNAVPVRLATALCRELIA